MSETNRRPLADPRRRVSETASLVPPAVPPAVVGLLAAIGSDDTGIPVLASAVSEFPSIAARLLMLANSAWSAPARPITSLHDACLRLGLRVVRTVSLAMAVARPFDPNRCRGFDVTRYWSSALLTAEGAALLSPVLVRQDPACDEGTMRSAGLLHNLGLLWMADRWPAQTAEALAAVASGVSLEDALRATAGMDHHEAAGELGLTWGLPGPLVAAMRFCADQGYRGDHWRVAVGCGLAAGLAGRLAADSEGPADFETLPVQGLVSPDILADVYDVVAAKRDSVDALTTCLFGEQGGRR
jgi:HD-like signal output (HDOD) protein